MEDISVKIIELHDRNSKLPSDEANIINEECITKSDSLEKSLNKTEELNRLNIEKTNSTKEEEYSGQVNIDCSTKSPDLKRQKVSFYKSLDGEEDCLLGNCDPGKTTFHASILSSTKNSNKFYVQHELCEDYDECDDGSLNDSNLTYTISQDDGGKKAVSFQDSSLWQKYSYKDFNQTTLRMSNLPTRSPIDIEFKELNCYVPGCKKNELKTILKGVGGSFRHGQLTAIVGPSGAGKTTLMNILAGYRISNVTGSITINNKERNLKYFRMRSCFIMQDCDLLSYLSVMEYLEGAAALKLGDQKSQEDKTKVIEEILQTLGLTKCKNTLVVHLSGGEKKRLSIALELVNNPPVMFFDEPTSGLDSSHSYQCIQLLKSLAEGGRTIVCTIHQPSAKLFDTFDALYALAEGHCIYRGKARGVLTFLGSLGLDCPTYHNPADFLVEVASGEYGSFIEQLSSKVNGGQWQPGFSQSQSLDIVKINENMDASIASEEGLYVQKRNNVNCPTKQPLLMSHDIDKHVDYPASFLTQFKILFWRSIISITRDTFLTKLRALVHIVVGIFIGLLYYRIGDDAHEARSNIGYLFFGVLFFTFTSMIPTTLTFPLEMNVLVREHLNHWYGLKAYYLAKTMADVPFQIVFAILYVVISYFMTNQPFEVGRFLLTLYFSITISLVAQSIGLSIGAASNPQQAVFLGPALAIPPLLFCGFLVSFSAIPSYFRWITYISYIRYAFEGVLISTYGFHRQNLACSEEFCALKSSSKVLEMMDVEESMMYMDFVLILLYFVLVRFLGYFILRWKFRKER